MKNLKTLIPYPNKVEITAPDYFNFSLQNCSVAAEGSYSELFFHELKKSPEPTHKSKECQVTILTAPELPEKRTT